MKRRLNNLSLLGLGLVSTTNAFIASTRVTHRAATTTLKRRHDDTTLAAPITTTKLNMFDMSILEPIADQISQTLFFPPPETISTTRIIQAVGETSFAGMLAIAAAQGALVMRSYQTNPDGGLIVPPGLTMGDEDATSALPLATPSLADLGLDELETKSPALTDAEVEALVCETEDTALTCAMKKKWYHVTTQIMAIALIPLAAVAGPSWGLAAWMMRYGHIMHMAVIFGLTHICDFFRKLPTTMVETTTNNGNPLQATTTTKTQQAVEEDPIFASDHPRIVVLGDSMSVGIGTCEVFDDQKVYDIPLHKEEHVDNDAIHNNNNLPGPMFPKALAQTLSQRLQKPVAWRSAGVDGGATMDIAEHLMDVVREEVNKGQAPDLVVVLTGSNDLKHLLNGSASLKGFRSNLMDLAHQIRQISPKTRVVFPALPTYRMDKKSILNVFPLSVFLDGFMGVWDSQKMAVADTTPGVMHVGLKVADVAKWYDTEDEEEDASTISLIAADGIHPNARCYKKWGAFVGNNLADQVIGPAAVKKTDISSSSYRGGFQVPAAFGVAKQHQ